MDFGKGVRENVIKNWDTVWGDMTPEKVQEKVDLIIGKLKQAASQSGEAVDHAASDLAETGRSTGQPPQQAMEQLKQAGPGKQVRFKNGQVWMLDESGNPVQVEQARKFLSIVHGGGGGQKLPHLLTQEFSACCTDRRIVWLRDPALKLCWFQKAGRNATDYRP